MVKFYGGILWWNLVVEFDGGVLWWNLVVKFYGGILWWNLVVEEDFHSVKSLVRVLKGSHDEVP